MISVTKNVIELPEETGEDPDLIDPTPYEDEIYR